VSLSEREEAVCEAIAARRDELVELTSALVGFDTTARNPDDPPRDEAALQGYLAERLRAAGADVDLWEPTAGEVEGRPLVPPGLGFEGRPQLVGRFAGAGGGKSLLLNGHIECGR
jgi:acetylornithine deacetylase